MAVYVRRNFMDSQTKIRRAFLYALNQICSKKKLPMAQWLQQSVVMEVFYIIQIVPQKFIYRSEILICKIMPCPLWAAQLRLMDPPTVRGALITLRNIF